MMLLVVVNDKKPQQKQPRENAAKILATRLRFKRVPAMAATHSAVVERMQNQLVTVLSTA